MNHPSEWQQIYHPKLGKRVYRHKGTGLVTDSLFKLGKVLKKPLVNLGKKVAEKGINKASDVAVKRGERAVKKAGDKIGSILRNRGKPKPKPKALAPAKLTTRGSELPKPPKTHREDMIMLNNLLSQL